MRTKRRRRPPPLRGSVGGRRRLPVTMESVNATCHVRVGGGGGPENVRIDALDKITLHGKAEPTLPCKAIVPSFISQEVEITAPSDGHAHENALDPPRDAGRAPARSRHPARSAPSEVGPADQPLLPQGPACQLRQ